MSISDTIAQKISSELNFDKEKSEVIRYGAFALINILFNLFFVVLFGYLLGVVYEALIVSFSSSILRKFSGGVHASRPSTCIIVGTFATITLAVLASYLFNNMAPLSIIAAGIVFSIWSYYIILKKAPIDSKAKPINQEKKARMKKKSIKTLIAYFIIMVVLTSLYYFTQNKLYLLYTICIYLGFMWQTYTLTIIGHKTLYKIDCIFIYIFFRKKEVT